MNAHHRESIVDAHSLLRHQVSGDGDGGQVQALRGKLGSEGTPLGDGVFREPREGRAPLLQTHPRLRFWRGGDGRDLKLLIAKIGSVKRLCERLKERQAGKYNIIQLEHVGTTPYKS